MFFEKNVKIFYNIIEECKNYSSDVNDPELDPLADKFSTKRGRLGLLSCKKIDNTTIYKK